MNNLLRDEILGLIDLIQIEIERTHIDQFTKKWIDEKHRYWVVDRTLLLNLLNRLEELINLFIEKKQITSREIKRELEENLITMKYMTIQNRLNNFVPELKFQEDHLYYLIKGEFETYLDDVKFQLRDYLY